MLLLRRGELGFVALEAFYGVANPLGSRKGMTLLFSGSLAE